MALDRLCFLPGHRFSLGDGQGHGVACDGEALSAPDLAALQKEHPGRAGTDVQDHLGGGNRVGFRVGWGQGLDDAARVETTIGEGGVGHDAWVEASLGEGLQELGQGLSADDDDEYLRALGAALEDLIVEDDLIETDGQVLLDLEGERLLDAASVREGQREDVGAGDLAGQAHVDRVCLAISGVHTERPQSLHQVPACVLRVALALVEVGQLHRTVVAHDGLAKGALYPDRLQGVGSEVESEDASSQGYFSCQWSNRPMGSVPSKRTTAMMVRRTAPTSPVASMVKVLEEAPKTALGPVQM